MNILITGATGFVGKQLGKALVRRGHQITIVTRNEKQAKLNLPFPCKIISGDLSQTSLTNLPQLDAVIHLAGENVGSGRWSEEKKQAILLSRQIFTANLLASLHDQKKLHTFVSASAIGFYGDTQNNTADENSPAGKDFLSSVCQKWCSRHRPR
jgi:NAD dependent epimerase/dehydratase family enzyme